MNSKAQLNTILFVVVASLVTGAILYRADGVSATREALADDPGGFGDKSRTPPSVEAMHPYRRDIQRVTRVLAHVEPYREAVVYSMVTGVVEPDPIEEGTRVDPDSSTKVLCTLDVPHLDADVATARSQAARATATKAQAAADVAKSRQGVLEASALGKKSEGQVLAAQADRDKAQAEVRYREVIYNRLASVHARSPSVVSPEDVDEAKGKLDIAKADLTVAEVGIEQAREEVKVAAARRAAALAHVASAEAGVAAAAAEEAVANAKLKEAEVAQGFATISTPIKGVVAARMIDTGSLVKDGGRNSGAKPLFRIVDDDKLRVWFSLAMKDAPHCRAGSKVVIMIEEVADPVTGEKPFELEATITRVTDVLDNVTRTMKAEVEIVNPKGVDGAKLLRAGMFARVEVSLEVHEGVLVLPTRAVATRKHKSSVLIVKDGVVNKISVEIGADDGVEVEVKDGVTEAHIVIIKGMGLVADGEKVNAVLVTPGDDK